MKNIDVLLGKQRQTHRSPAHLKRKEAELCEIYRNGLRKPSNTGREIYIKNIITAPNIVNIHTTTIQFDGGPRRRSEHCDALLPRTEKYQSKRRFQFNGSNQQRRTKQASGKLDSQRGHSDALLNFEENFKIVSKERRGRFHLRLAKERRTKTLEHESRPEEFEVHRRHKTITKDESTGSIGIAHRTIDRELELGNLEFRQELDWNEVELPLTPAEAIGRYNRYLTNFERKQILDFEQVYFIGHRAHKVQAASGADFDNKQNEYKYVLNDHIAYRYELLETIGRGAFGQVIKVYDHKRKCLGALKIIKNKDNFYKQALVQLKILRYIRDRDVRGCANVVRVRDFVVFRGHVCIIFELLDVSLYDFMKKNQFQGFTFDLIRKLTVQILQSLMFLEAHHIVHCDLKPENIVLKQPGKSGIRLIDFGTSCFESEKVYTYIQSRFYRAPEIVLGVPYGCRIDVWSFGCIAAELFTGYPLFPAESEEEHLYMMYMALGPPSVDFLKECSRSKTFFTSDGGLKKSIVPKKLNEQPRSLRQLLDCEDEIFMDFIQQCLRWNPEERISARAALMHDFIVRGLPEDIRKEHLKNMSSTNPYNLLPTEQQA